MLEVVSQDVPGCQHCLKKSSRFMTRTWCLVWAQVSAASWPHGRNTPTRPAGYQRELQAVTLVRVPEQTRLVHASIIHSWRGTSCSCDSYRGRLKSTPDPRQPSLVYIFFLSVLLHCIFGCGKNAAVSTTLVWAVSVFPANQTSGQSQGP